MNADSKSKSQHDKFKEAARQLETDDDEGRFEERLRKLVKDRAHSKGGIKRDKDDGENDG